MNKEIEYKGKKIEVLFPSGYFQYYSDKERRFLKFDTLKAAKESISSESKKSSKGEEVNESRKNNAMKITLNELRQLVKSVIREEMENSPSKEEKALEKLQKILTPSDIEFLKKEYSKLGKEGLAGEVEDVMQLSEMEDLDTYGELSPKEKKLRSIINKIIGYSGVISTLGIVPAAMISGGAGLGFGIAALASFLLKDAAYWNRKGGIHRDAYEDENY